MLPLFALLMLGLFHQAQNANPNRTLLDIRPDRTTTSFQVIVYLSCHENDPFTADVQLWEHNSFIDEPISEKVTVHHNASKPAFVEVKGEMFNIDEPGEEFEPYLWFEYNCGGDMTKKAVYALPYCFKAQKYCDYDLAIDLWNIPYQPTNPLRLFGDVFSDSNAEKINTVPYA